MPMKTSGQAEGQIATMTKKKEKKKKQKAERETSNKYAKAKGGGDPNWVSVSGDARCVALGFVFGIQLINATRERSGVDRV